MGDAWSSLYTVLLRFGDNPLVVAMSLVISVLMYDRIRLLAAIDKQSERLEQMTLRHADTSLEIVKSIHELRICLAEVRGALDALHP